MSTDESLLRRPLWIASGQLGIVFAVFIGFGAHGEVRPKVGIAGLLVFLGGAVMLGPVSRVSRVVVTAPVVAVVAWWLASYLWTFNVYGWWTDTQKNLPFVITCVVLMGILPLERFQSALVTGCYLAITYTALELLVHPGTATVNPDGNLGWRGGFVHKNDMGPFMVFAILAIVSFDRRSPRRTIGVAVAAVLVVGARSTTALGAGLVTLVIVWMLRRLVRSDRKARASIVVSSLAAIVAGWILYSTVVPALLGASGKDSTLTGRTEIWAGVWKAITERPWQGYGVGGVWLVPSVDPARSILNGLGFTVFHSHNGYLEIMLLLGVVGLALFVWLMVSLLRLSLLALYRTPTMAIFSAGYVVLIAVLCITEVTVFGMWLSLLAAFQCTAVAERHRQREARLPPTPPRRGAAAATLSISAKLSP